MSLLIQNYLIFFFGAGGLVYMSIIRFRADASSKGDPLKKALSIFPRGGVTGQRQQAQL